MRRAVLLALILALGSGCILTKPQRQSRRAKKLVTKAIRLDPSIVKKDSILVHSSSIDTFIPIDTSSGFVDTAFNDFGDSFRALARDYHLSNRYILELEALVSLLESSIKDSVRSHKAFLDTFYYSNDTLSIKVWQEGGRLRFDVKMNDIWVRSGGIEIKKPTWYEKNHWWMKIVGFIFLLVVIAIFAREGIRKLFSKPK